jgi:hypothetical protein
LPSVARIERSIEVFFEVWPLSSFFLCLSFTLLRCFLVHDHGLTRPFPYIPSFLQRYPLVLFMVKRANLRSWLRMRICFLRSLHHWSLNEPSRHGPNSCLASS